MSLLREEAAKFAGRIVGVTLVTVPRCEREAANSVMSAWGHERRFRDFRSGLPRTPDRLRHRSDRR